ncbi:MAG: 30S ribosomal protein S18 [Candidatus Portnoybacteria bacterium RBG_13_40_8]|uniref:Small ribosomal subunit protein bS18 n=1 Tax=Candidatus Portnoybacteria bacterium RBG_13_40_8 TaxID=1801990 RepID=A0A1G2F6V1_9BACT|nr:MAG: 30S ribosomal protein S18 [Candidatus Portnoybacteria bacterium RBG_13_40_8]OGZ35971.1 MAG: 30S ribosomal protein S18 [Candidatus Portnoybacteria bacterium RIFCSPHIGHO2_01_FULL_39_19]
MRDCYFCKRNIKDIDYKDTENLSRFLDPLCKIKSRRRSGTCAKHQRKLSRAIKKARILGLLPFTSR